jgi:hypothetical protein
MNDSVKRQYEAYPYPARDPRDEKKRLITGSPSHLTELTHWLFGGSSARVGARCGFSSPAAGRGTA